ncbi:MAG: HAD hydrolase-like protein [Clostridia bacterium]|nr:HAD hydrolase-like protein [Clostridia bacterium]
MKYIIDLDGTLLNGTQPNLDSVLFMHYLIEHQIDFIIMTNSIKSPEKIMERLKVVGIYVSQEQIMNPIVAMNAYLENKGYKNAYVVGSFLETQQVKVPLEDESPEIILLLDFEKENMGYDILQKIFHWMEAGIPVVTASRSLYYLKDHKKQLDTGAFVTLLEQVSGQNIEVFGKPSFRYFESGIALLKTTKEQVTVIGDDYQTDMLGALNAGCQGILLQSGKYEQGDEEKISGISCVDHFMAIFNKR